MGLIICLFEGKAAEEEGGGKGGAKFIFPKEEGESANSFNITSIFYDVHVTHDQIFKVDILLDQLTRQFPMRVPPTQPAVEGPRQGFYHYQPICVKKKLEVQVPSSNAELSGRRTTQPLLLGARQLVGV